MSRFWKYLSVFSLTSGGFCLFFASFFHERPILFPIIVGLGAALLPAGLISIITSLSSSQLIEKTLRKALEKTSADLRSSIKGLKVTTNYLNTSKNLGVSMVYGNRNQALSPFLCHLEEYVQKKNIDEIKKQIVFVGSSLKGVIEDDPSLSTQMERILKLGKDECRFHFLLTHP